MTRKYALSSNYRIILKRAFEERKRANPLYSLRAMSIHLGLSHSALGLIIKGTKNLSPEMALQVARKLKLEKLEQKYFCALVQLESTKDPELKAELRQKIRELRPYPTSVEVTSRTATQWYDGVILAMSEVPAIEFVPAQIARRLQLTVAEVELAFARLETLKLLERDGENKWRRPIGGRYFLQATPGDPRMLQDYQMFYRKAADSIVEQPREQRSHRMETFAFSPRLVPQAQEIEERLFGQLLALASEARDVSDDHTDVYCAMFALYSLTPGR